MQTAERLDLLARVLGAAARAPGNRDRFSAAGLIDSTGQLTADWQASFERLRILRKAELRSHSGAFLADASDVVYRGNTSGTTSKAFTYFAGEQWNRRRIEARQRAQRWWRIDSLPVVNVASRLGPVALRDRSLLGRVDYAFLALLQQAMGHGPVVLRGYPSRLCEVAIALHRYQIQLSAHSVSAVVATGERLFEVQRSLLTKTFEVPVIDEYGCQESGISGMSCPETGRIHLDEDRCLYEWIGGECVTTDLWNTTMPMVRYVSGDVIAPYAEACPCGRPGLTAKIIGRQEAGMSEQQTRLAAVEAPSFPGILNYQVRIEAPWRQLWVQPASLPNEETLAPLKVWFDSTFGAGDTEVLVDSPFSSTSLFNASSAGPLQTADADTLNAPSCEMWLMQITQQAWSRWISQPLPVGAAGEVSALLQQIVMPQQVVGRGVSHLVLALMQRVRKSALTRDDRLEVMKLRVMLWAVSLMTQSELADHAGDVHRCYRELTERFCTLRDRCSDFSDFSALGFDLLAPLLTLDSGAEQWTSISKEVCECWTDGLKADRFTVHHYLAVMEIAGRNAQRRGHSWTATLRPLSAVLLGDFSRVGSALSLADVATWMEMVHERPNAFWMESEDGSFASGWRTFRRSLLTRSPVRSQRQPILKAARNESSTHLSALFKLASSPKKMAHCWLEKGYMTLVFGEPLDADEWLDILSVQVNVLTSVGKASNPMAWSPILKALAPVLLTRGQHELAYACLFAAAPPNSAASGFDRRSMGINGKQSVISVV